MNMESKSFPSSFEEGWLRPQFYPLALSLSRDARLTPPEQSVGLADGQGVVKAKC